MTGRTAAEGEALQAELDAVREEGAHERPAHRPSRPSGSSRSSRHTNRLRPSPRGSTSNCPVPRTTRPVCRTSQPSRRLPAGDLHGVEEARGPHAGVGLDAAAHARPVLVGRPDRRAEHPLALRGPVDRRGPGLLHGASTSTDRTRVAVTGSVSGRSLRLATGRLGWLCWDDVREGNVVRWALVGRGRHRSSSGRRRGLRVGSDGLRVGTTGCGGGTASGAGSGSPVDSASMISSRSASSSARRSSTWSTSAIR